MALNEGTPSNPGAVQSAVLSKSPSSAMAGSVNTEPEALSLVGSSGTRPGRGFERHAWKSLLRLWNPGWGIGNLVYLDVEKISPHSAIGKQAGRPHALQIC